MRANRSIHKWIFVGAGGVFVCSILTLFVQHRTTWFGSYAGGGSEDQGVAAATSGKLSELETRQVRDMVARLADSSLAGDAAIQLRRHIETVVRQEPAKAAATMIVALESLASRFEKLDLEPQRFGVGLTASVLEWFAAHPETPGTRLLIPTREILDAAFSDSATELHGVALQAVVHFWRWAPEKTDDPTVHKSVALLRTKLHDRCVSMLHSPEESVRTHAVAALAAFPDATAAAQCIVLLEDEKESVPVRRT